VSDCEELVGLLTGDDEVEMLINTLSGAGKAYLAL
jgi:hypothetical protein